MPDDPATSPCPPLTDDDWPARIAELRTGFAGALNVYRVMAHHPDLLAAWAPLRAHIVQRSALGPEPAEIVILRTGHRLGAPYEWAHHITRARALGMDDARIAAVAGPPEAMAPDDALLARGVDALFDAHGLPAELERDLAARFGREAVFDLIATVGFYSTLGYLLNTYQPPLDEAVASELARRPLGG